MLLCALYDFVGHYLYVWVRIVPFAFLRTVHILIFKRVPALFSKREQKIVIRLHL